MNLKWQQVEQMFTELFERQWYTNHGMLGKQFEHELEGWLQVKNAVCVANPAIGLTMALECLRVDNIRTHHESNSRRVQNAMKLANLEVQLTGPAQALLMDIKEIEELASSNTSPPNVPCVIHADCSIDPPGLVAKINNLFSAVNMPWLVVFSFEMGQSIEAQGASCIATACDDTAELLRNIRSSYGVREARAVVKTANGRMSEAQAAFGLLSLKDKLEQTV